MRLSAHMGLSVRPLIGRATGSRGIGVLVCELWLGSPVKRVEDPCGGVRELVLRRMGVSGLTSEGPAGIITHDYYMQ